MKSATPTANKPVKLSTAGALNAVALEPVCFVLLELVVELVVELALP
jgi:hypothetical protein